MTDNEAAIMMLTLRKFCIDHNHTSDEQAIALAHLQDALRQAVRVLDVIVISPEAK